MNAFGRVTEVPHGPLGSLIALRLMAAMITAEDAGLRDYAARWRHSAQLAGETDTELAARIFDHARASFVYTEDGTDTRLGVRAEEVIQSPGVSHHQMRVQGHAQGDCDDYVVWLGAIYHALGFPVSLVAVSFAPDRGLDHVYLTVFTDGAWRGADAIPDAAGIFGWQPGAREGVTARVEWAV